MSPNFFWLFLIKSVLLLTNFCDGYNILAVMNHPGMSHVEVFLPLFKALGQQGHNLTIFSYYSLPLNFPNTEHRQFESSGVRHVIPLDENGDSYFNTKLKQLRTLPMLSSWANHYCNIGLQSETFQNFLKEDRSYDVVLMEIFNTNCFFGLMNKFKAPFIGLGSCSMLPWHPEWFGTPEHASYISNIFTGYPTRLSFLQRVENTFFNIYSKLWYKYDMESRGNKLSQKYIGEKAVAAYNASLYLVNTHHSLHGARPLTPSIIEVGGIHVANRKAKQLPEGIESWINNSEAGVIYFSLGSMIKGDTFPEERRNAFSSAFSRLPHRVIWKWENGSMQDKPDNVMISKWTPQFDILCHPNVKVFISHGGLLGVTEAVHCGVPIIVMPQFGDQHLNARALKNREAGVILNLQTATEDIILKALRTVLTPEFQQKAKDLSKRFRDRPLSPIDAAVYWVEHVARHNGASHMRSPAIDLPVYQYLMLDVWIFFILALQITSYLTYKSVKFFSKALFSKKGKEKIL